MKKEHRKEGIKKGMPVTDSELFLRKEPFSEQPYLTSGRTSGKKVIVALILKSLAIFIAFFIVYFLYIYADTHCLFRTTRVIIDGTSHLDKQEISTLIKKSFPLNLMTVNPAEVARRLKRINWIQNITVCKQFPNTIHIYIQERIPVGIARLGKLWLFDKYGVFLDEYKPTDKHFDRPILTGLSNSTDGNSAIRNVKKIRIYLNFLKEINSKGEKLSQKISEIDLSDPSDLIITPISGIPIVHLGYEKFSFRLKRFFKIIRKAIKDNGPIAEVDMRYDDKVIIKPATSK